jgi:hypothetical protein
MKIFPKRGKKGKKEIPGSPRNAPPRGFRAAHGATLPQNPNHYGFKHCRRRTPGRRQPE